MMEKTQSQVLFAIAADLRRISRTLADRQLANKLNEIATDMEVAAAADQRNEEWRETLKSINAP
jgi:hypothetical protein